MGGVEGHQGRVHLPCLPEGNDAKEQGYYGGDGSFHDAKIKKKVKAEN